MRKVIANTTPLIALANTGHLDLLRELYGEILIPEAVREEIKSEPAKTLIAESAWIKTITIADQSQRKLYSSRLHAGEIEVMMLAREQEADLLLIDDNAAKNTAKFLGFSVTGTLGVLLKAKKQGYLNTVKPVLEDLVNDGFYIQEEIIRLALKEAKEE